MVKRKKEVIKGFVPREVLPIRKFKCNICLREYSSENFDIANEKDCPLCDNRDCVTRIK